MRPTGPGPLHGVRVIDLTTVVMGPMAAKALGDLGADVIRVESPEGDFMRDFPPQRTVGMSSFTMAVNRNKRSVVLDLKSDEGRSAMLDLVAGADVFMTNVRRAALVRLKLTDDDLRARRPDLVYCSATGFGSDGPYGDKAAYDDVIQAASGLASTYAWNRDEPAFSPSILCDKVTALYITYSILAALYRRATTGEGDHVEVPMAESMAEFNLIEHLSGLAFVPPMGDVGYARLRSPHRKPRRTADGWACIMPYTDRNWRDFFRLSGLDHHIDDPRFATVADRLANVDVLYEILDEAATHRTTAEWAEACDAHSIPMAPVNDLARLEDDPHFAAVGLFEEHDHPTEGRYRVVRSPMTFRSGLPGVFRPTARLGAHTAEVFTELGYDAEAVERLTAALGQSRPDDPGGAGSG